MPKTIAHYLADLRTEEDAFWEQFGLFPAPGEVRYDTGRRRYEWVECPECGKGRWVQVTRGEPFFFHCISCAKLLAAKSSCEATLAKKWKAATGYVFCYVSKDSSFFTMSRNRNSQNGRVAEHRLAMAKHLGRCLEPNEVVHHKNGIKDDNRLENLELTTKREHATESYSKGYTEGYRSGREEAQSEEMKELLQQVKLLQWQLKEVKNGENYPALP